MAALTNGLIANVTGKKVNVVTFHNYYGNLVFLNQIDETFYFAFENQSGDQSSGAVVYRGENEEGTKRFDWMYACYNRNGVCKAYTEIADAGHDWNWGSVWVKLMESGTSSHAEYENCVSDAIITQQPPVTYQGIMSLKGGSKA